MKKYVTVDGSHLDCILSINASVLHLVSPAMHHYYILIKGESYNYTVADPEVNEAIPLAV